ncbi:MAG: hypothetical protein P1U53_13450 [Sulfitobacter sp.]|nr:hypothetical protein [Sulfitobacter sp.]
MSDAARQPERARPPLGNQLSAAFLLLVSAAAICRIFANNPAFIWVELIALLGFFAVEFPRLTKMARALVLASIALVALEYARGTFDAELTMTAIGRAAFMAFFLNSLSFLQHAAGRSPLLLNSGTILVHQPPGRRYLVLTFGAALFGMLLNLSTIGLLGTMIRKGSEGGANDEARRIAGIRRKRMTLAMLRGFASIPMWSPITVTIALVTAAIPGLTWAQIAIYSAPLAAVFLLTGWIIDRLGHALAPAPVEGSTPSLLGLMPLLALVVAVPSTAYGLSAALGTSMIAALLIALPLISFGWLLIQERHQPRSLSRTAQEVTAHVLPSLPNMRTEITLFSCSAFLGVLIADIIDTVALGQFITGLGLSSGVTLAISAWLIVGLSLIGFNPIITVTIAAGALPQLAGLAISPVAVGVMLVSVWTISVNATPYGTSVRLASRMIEVPPERLGYVWNGFYALAALIVLSAALLSFG